MTDSAREASEQSPEEEFGLSAVRELVRLISETDITEIQIERGSTKLHIKRGALPAPQPSFFVTPSLAPAIQQAPAAALPHAPQYHASLVGAVPASGEPSEADLPPGAQTIVSPMVGTYYSSPSPKDPPFVKEGDAIHTGEVVGIVEAMKIMNEIESEYSGKVLRVLVHSGQPVEYGQPLLIVVPA
ncbi:MAG TPA: acetyl-CoA carboxylase biotin carboxyl carrier protein [Roseiflexaceae bacterium]|nr:acetyl-CoA carboxylase biotin carboxyl carrier protein [Roseiflexaceae bacterium]